MPQPRPTRTVPQRRGAYGAKQQKIEVGWQLHGLASALEQVRLGIHHQYAAYGHFVPDEAPALRRYYFILGKLVSAMHKRADAMGALRPAVVGSMPQPAEAVDEQRQQEHQREQAQPGEAQEAVGDQQGHS